MYELIKTEHTARRGRFKTVHGTVETPAFMNVATAAAIKGGLSAFDLREIKCQVMLCNTYHLHVRPGDEIIRQIGTSSEDAVALGYWEDYQTIAADWSSYAVSFDEDGMTVAFSPYEIACYAAGPQIFKLSYDFLKPYLSDHGLEILELNVQPEN